MLNNKVDVDVAAVLDKVEVVLVVLVVVPSQFS